MTTMRAVTYSRYGPPEVLRVVEVPVPAVKRGEVLIRVHATSVNGGEIAGRAGRLRLATGRRFPKRIGIDFTGEIVQTAPDAFGLRPGDRVWGVLPRAAELSGAIGAAADFVAVPAVKVAIAPRTVPLVDAVSLVAGGTTAITALQVHARLQPGERLLVRGANGGVGSVAVQLGKALGAHVTALTSARNFDFVTTIGADKVVDYTTTPPSALGRFDVVLDTVGIDLLAHHRLLTPTGRMVAVTLDLDHPGRSVAALLRSRLEGVRRIRFFGGNPQRDLLDELTRWVDAGDLKPVVHAVYPLESIAEAHRALEARGVRGKHIVRVI